MDCFLERVYMFCIVLDGFLLDNSCTRASFPRVSWVTRMTDLKLWVKMLLL